MSNNLFRLFNQQKGHQAIYIAVSSITRTIMSDTQAKRKKRGEGHTKREKKKFVCEREIGYLQVVVGVRLK